MGVLAADGRITMERFSDPHRAAEGVAVAQTLHHHMTLTLCILFEHKMKLFP